MTPFASPVAPLDPLLKYGRGQGPVSSASGTTTDLGQ
uniref:Macrophage alpha1-antitrypsin (alpha1-AT) mRNA 5'-end (L17) n=1 Tax=Homo sapiens TaxID=9606 RepID=V9H0U0_HUMAN|nr:unnamed protein product [Homo sapiens]